MICRSCGQSLEQGVRYCPECGTSQGPTIRRSRVRGSRGRHPASRFQLADPTGKLSIELPWNRLVRVGRHPSTDLTLLNPSVSRFHAELITTEDGCRVRDLDSSNGTFVNGVSIREITLRGGDELRFGGASFRVEVVDPTRSTPPAAGAAKRRAGRGRHPHQRHLKDLATALAQRLDRDAILDLLVRGALEATGADRASVALVEEHPHRIDTSVYHARSGEPARDRHVPRSIAAHCLSQRVAVITEAAERDRRFDGDSIVTLGVRSAMCAPILGRAGEPIGVCYLDHTTNRPPFSPDDLSYLVALTGIAAAALERDR